MLVWTMYRTVWSLNCGAGPAGPAGPVAQVPTHRDRPAGSSAWTPADRRNATAIQAQTNVRFLMDLNIRSPRERLAGHRDRTAPSPPVMLRRSARCRALYASKARRAGSRRPATLSDDSPGGRPKLAGLFRGRRVHDGGSARRSDILRPQRALGPHEDRVERRRRGDEQAVSLGAAEADIGDHLGNADLAQESAVRAVAMDAIAGARPDVAAYIEPEAVEESRIAGRKDLATRERAAIRAHREAPDMAGTVFHVGRAGVGDVEELFIGREGQPIGLHEIGRHRHAVAARRIVAVDEGGADLRRSSVAFVVGIDAVGRIGEPDATVGFDNDIVGRVQAFALVTLDEHGPRAVVLGSRQAATLLLAGDQTALAVDGVPIGVVAGLAEHRHRAIGLVVPHHPVVGDVRPNQVAACCEVGRTLRPAGPRPKHLEMHVGERHTEKPFVEDGIWGTRNQLTTFWPRP